MRPAFKKLFQSVAVINIVTFLVILLVIVVPATYKYLSDIERGLMELMATHLKVTARQSASMIDVEDVAALVDPHFLLTPAHARVVTALSSIQTDFSVDDAVIYRRLPDGEFVYIADGKNNFAIGSPVTLHERFPETFAAATRAWLSVTPGSTDLFESGRSKYFQINMPLTIEGKVVAILMLNQFATPVAQEIRERQKIIVISLTVIVVAGILAFWLVSRHTLRPLQPLHRAAQQIAKGNLDVKIPPVRGKNEITQLSGTFRQMVADLKENSEQLAQHREHLEDLVRERTANLETSNAQLKQEIVEREKAEQALRESEAYLALILESAPDGIITFNEDGITQGFNKSAETIFGYTREEIIGLPVSRLLPEEYRKWLAPRKGPKLSIADRKWLGREMETEGLCKDGKKFPMMVNVSEVRIGRHTTYTAIVHDISELKRHEQQIIEASQAKSTFLSHMSHEMRNPLNTILGFTQLLQHDPDLGDSHKEDLAVIGESGNQLLELINDVLDINKIEAGRVELNDEPFDLRAMVDSVGEMFRLRAEEKNIRVQSQLYPDLPLYVHGDRSKLRQVLVNLVSNAVKFTEEGGVKIAVEREAGKILFTVSDSGVGIPEDQQEIIFEPFRQSASGKSSGEGTGLGLSITKSFVQVMGGEITLKSTAGKGSSFAFSLALPEMGEEEASTEDIDRIVTGLEGDAEWRVLIVDDDPAHRETLCKTLLHIGFSVREAENGQTAVDRFAEYQPHLVLMDLRMPRMDGLEATRLIRSLEGGASIPIFAVTAHALEHDRNQIIAAGCNEMIPKPLDEAKLLEKMAHFLPIRYRYGHPGTNGDKAS